jgi:phage-related minor tail protein
MIKDQIAGDQKSIVSKTELAAVTKDLTDTQKKNIESLRDIGKVQQLVDYEKDAELLKLLEEPYIKAALSAEQYSRSVRFLTEEQKKLKDEMTLVPAVVTAQKVIIPRTEFNKEYYEALASVVPRATNELDRFASSATNIQDVLINLSMSGIGAIEDSFVNLINGTNSVKESFKSMANSIINDIIRMTVRQQISAPIAAALGSFIGGMGSAGAGGSLPYSSSLRESYSAASTMNYFRGNGRAIGGNVSAGMPYTVGERGAELFVPNTSGKIISAGNSKSAGNTTVVNQSVNISAGVAQTVRAEIYSLLPRIKMETMAAINDTRMRSA